MLGHVKPSDKVLRKFPCAIWSVKTFPHMDKEETFFLENYTLAWSEFLLDNYLFIKPENLKASLKISPLTFLREKVSTFAVSK